MAKRVLALSLRQATERLLDGIAAQLQAEFEGEEIEFRQVHSDFPLLRRCYVNRVPLGPILPLDDLVGYAIQHGLEATQQRIAQHLSDAIMMHLQTVG